MGRRLVGFIVLVLALASLPLALYVTGRGPAGAGPRVGLIQVDGVIADGPADPWSSGASARELVAQLEEVRTSPRFAAAVVRINSPGGTAPASQEIAAAIGRVREAGKPVVASMGDTAASGGYYVAAAADLIVANPATTTGSIGVVTQVVTATELLDRLGVTVDLIASGPFKAMGNPAEPLSPAERALLQAMVDDVHEQFVAAVVRGRGLPEEQVRALADGRVLTGRQAMEAGLVDRLGDLEEAVRLAGELAGLEGRPPVEPLARPRGLLERLLQIASSGRFSLTAGSLLGGGPQPWPVPWGPWRWLILTW